MSVFVLNQTITRLKNAYNLLSHPSVEAVTIATFPTSLDIQATPDIILAI